YDINKLRDKKILIYGAGDVGTDYYYQLSIFGITIAAISDKRASFINFPFRCDIIEPYSIRDYIYDYLLIAVKSERIAKKIKTELSLYGISEEKILWKRPIRMRIS
ncbi:MAG TPA: hypothetical protein DCX21_00285, partial [Eubacterium sp.]|nr:hypothetical protein [Eubacterium sp.]